MHAPVSMLTGFAARGNTALVIGLLVGLPVVASMKARPSTAQCLDLINSYTEIGANHLGSKSDEHKTKSL